MTINHWTQLHEKPAIKVGDVQLWFTWLDEEVPMRFWEILSTDERARAIRLRSSQNSQRFIAARGILRNILGRYLAQAPGHLVFSYGSQGKPALMGNMQDKLSFNLSHSNGLAVIAIANGLEVGVDIEEVRPLSSLDAITSTFFSTIERDELNAVPPSDRLNAFFTLWTCKEAVLKATGTSLTHQSANVIIQLQPKNPMWNKINLVVPSECQYQLEMLKPSEGYVGALASHWI